MINYSITGTANADAEEVAAAISAVIALLESETIGSVALSNMPSGWQLTIRLSGQGLPIAKPATVPAWNTAERIRCAGRPGNGIVGL
jgi:hypothetical protein